MDIATCVNELDASTIQDVKKFKIQYIQVHTINVYSEFRKSKKIVWIHTLVFGNCFERSVSWQQVCLNK